MWYNTRITDLLGIDYPIFQGPFGGKFSTLELTSIVSNMGGLGGFGAYTLTPNEITDICRRIRTATDKPFNINLWVSHSDVPPGGITDEQYEEAKAIFRPYFEELKVAFPEKPVSLFSNFSDQVQAVLDARPAVFSFIFGIPPAEILQQCRKKGIITAGGATTPDEAIALESAGVDLIVASGFEGGGHRPSFLASTETSLTGTFVLVQQIKARVRIPVIAAGGIATGKGIAASLALGADAVQIGTAFLACEESGAPALHRKLLLSDAARYTVLSRAFTGRLGRGLMNRFATETKSRESGFLPFPLQGGISGALRQEAINRDRWDLLLAWGGQVASELSQTRASELMTSLISDTTSYINELKSRL